MNDIIDIFYNNIIKEASMGRVNCLFIYNIVFNTYLVEDNKHIESTVNVDNLFIPTLVIENKEKFNNLLLEYVIKAKSFYNLEKYENELREQNQEELIKDRICIEKILMTLLWSNATVEDFEDPINFLKKRINLQKNLTEKFLRTFGRLSYHCKDIKITSFPYDIDSSMHIKLGEIKTFNNELLKETFELTKKCNNNLKK